MRAMCEVICTNKLINRILRHLHILENKITFIRLDKKERNQERLIIHKIKSILIVFSVKLKSAIHEMIKWGVSKRRELFPFFSLNHVVL